MKIVIDIDRLVLEGIPANAAERARIRESVEGELARLIRERGFGREIRSGAVPVARATAFEYRRESPQGTGRKIAQSVYTSLRGAK
jgi:hypothetical protein